MQNIFTKITQKNTNGSINNVICNSAQKGLIPQREYFDKDIANSDNTDSYFVIKKGDFVYNPRKSVTAPYGPVSIYNYDNNGIVSPLYLCFRAKETINTSFFEWYFKSSAWHRYVYLYGDSGVRHDRVSIKDATFFEMPLHIPCEAEQRELSCFLSLLEASIQKQQQLVDSLKSYKRGLILQIFSDSSREWQTAKIKDFAHITTGSSNTQDAIPNGEYPFFIRSENVMRSAKYIFDGEAVLTIGDGQIGKVFHYINGKFDCHQRVYMITNFTSVNARYFYHYFSAFFLDRAKRMSAKNTVDSVRMEMIADMEISYPNISEQFRIATLLDNFDKLIQEEINISHKLFEMKTALLQQLFI